MHSIAKFISFVFLPLFTPIYGLLIVLFVPSVPVSFLRLDSLYEYPLQVKVLYLLLFTVFIVLAPGLSFIVLRLNKTISSLGMDKQEERHTPIAIMTFYCLILYLFLLYQPENAMIPRIIMGMSVGGVLAGLSAYLINRFSKISLHGVGMGALSGFVFMYFLGMQYFSLWALIATFILGGIVLSARIFLNAHTLSQVAAGYGLGFITQILAIFVYQIMG
jgi:membrane-associated phospholipid phosphatase